MRASTLFAITIAISPVISAFNSLTLSPALCATLLQAHTAPRAGLARLMARLFAGEAAVVMATESRGASNARAKRDLGWTLRYPSWRQGFAAAYGQPEKTRRAA